jgi:biotin synthase
MMPESHVRLSAGRENMNEQMQALAFLAGANSIFYGEKLLTTSNPEADSDRRLFETLGIQPEAGQVAHDDEAEMNHLDQRLRERASDAKFYSAAN